jgi:hypothetical protein
MLISQFNLETTPFGFRLHTHKVGCFRVFGVFFLLPGLLMLAALFELIEVKSPPHGTIEWIVLFLLGLAFSGGGLALSLYRSYILIDTRLQKVIKQEGLFRLKNSDEVSLQQITEIIISRTIITDSDGPDYVAFPIILQAKNGHNFTLGEYHEMNDAIKVAIPIASRLGLKVFDSTIDGKPEIKTYQADKNEDLRQDTISSKYNYHDLNFKWDGHDNSLSRLLIANARGIIFYKIEYPNFIISRLIVALFSLGFFISFFGWKIHETVPEVLSGFWHDNFLTSPEVFFSTIFGTIFILFLLTPVLLVPITWLRPRKFSIIAVGSDGLYLHDPHALTMGRKTLGKPIQNQLHRYSDIIGMDLKTKKQNRSRKTWKWEKRDNFIGLRVGQEFYELAVGLDKEQLEIIANSIKPHMLRNPQSH